ncbi:protein kinase domain-containing protein [Azospirillum soli]|uniref:protein kinase domain-containing protein n=1 Tax=Azospirillum soli TaxID=1304799 RepID=UPI001AE49A7D|nr:serine/threonine protein kinase [Azospirillum soli]
MDEGHGVTHGTRKLGKYDLLGEIGRGATGVVHRAYDPATGRTVALKTIPLANIGDAALDRFRGDARAAARLSHPNIIAIQASGEHGGTAFVAMDCVEARPLDRILESGEPPSSDQALSILAQLLAALDHAHRAGLTHGTLGLADVLIDANGTIKVTGFGSGGLVAPDAGPADDIKAARAILATLVRGEAPSPAVTALLTTDFPTAATFAEAVAEIRNAAAPRVKSRSRAPLFITASLALAAAAGALGYALSEPLPPPSQASSPEAPIVPAAPEPPPSPPSVEEEPERQAKAAPEPEEPPPPPAAPALADLRKSLQDIRCAVLTLAEDDGRITVTGTATSESIRPQLHAILDQHTQGQPHRIDLRLASPALCEPLTLIEASRTANGMAPAPLKISLAASDAIYRGGQELVFDVTAPDFPAHLQVDYYTADGNVVHLLPNPLETSGLTDPRALRRLGDRAAGGRFWTIGPPFGNELIVVVASASPLFSTPRPEAEAASAYLPELKRALDASGPQTLATARFIATTAP